MKKLLSIAIPCYNSEAYMDRALKSVLIGEDLIEVIIVDDGSTDKTLERALMYQRKFPGIVKVVHKENGGHGDAVMHGLEAATGQYFKVLDSDDWLGKKALFAVIQFLKMNSKIDNDFDMIISDYVYEKEGKKHKKRVGYKSVMPVRTAFNWDKVGSFKPWQNILMHSVIYRTEFLKSTGLTLPKHTFYVDNIYVYHPLPYVKKLYYLDVDLYHYYIGRADQSVNESVMIKRIDQQLLVTKLMIEDYELRSLANENLRNYMGHYLSVMMSVCSSLLLRAKTEEARDKKVELWRYLREEYPHQYKYITKHFLGKTCKMESKAGEAIILGGYKLGQMFIGFN